MPSIFQKDCPNCAATVEIQAMRCDCGYCFEPEQGGDVSEYEQQQEQLYLDYVEARTVQAEAALTVAREDLAADPQNTYKAAQALLAEQNLNALQADLYSHRLRAASVKRTPKVVELRTTAAPKKPVAATVKPAVPVTQMRSTFSALAKPRMPVTPVPATPVKVAEAISQNTSTPVIAPKVTPPPSIARAPQPQPARRSVNGAAKPDAIFRQLQATKAEAAIRAQQAKAAKPDVPKIAPPIPKPVATPVAKPAPQPVVKHEAITPTPPPAPAKQECPNCTATVAADTKVCRCGYAFPIITQEVPALKLDATALALLNEALQPLTGPTRQRSR